MSDEITPEEDETETEVELPQPDPDDDNGDDDDPSEKGTHRLGETGQRPEGWVGKADAVDEE